MSAIAVTCRRTLGRARSLYATALAVAGFLAIAGATFALGFASADGGRLPLSAVWALGASPALPALVAFLAMDVWSEERHSGRIDMLLAVAVRERDYVIGKFLGVWIMAMAAVLVFAVSSVACLWGFAPSALDGAGLPGFLSALFALAVQCALWSAASVALSAMCRYAAAAAFASVVLTIALPRGIWAGLMAWSSEGRPTFGEMPLDAFVVDVASGLVPVGECAAYLLLAAVLVFVAAKAVASLRLVGRGAMSLRMSTGLSVLLALAFAVLAVRLALKLDATVELSSAGAPSALSPRTRGILAESSGDMTATCFLPRSDARFREAARMLRSLKRASEESGGARFSIRFVDPRWDIGAAERLVRRGVAVESLVFEKGPRIVSLSIADGISERACAATVRSLMSHPSRRSIYWTIGHGEIGFDTYDAFGMSDIARDLSREGYMHAPIDLAAARQIPDDCALVLVAGARDDLSRAELGLIDSYLRGGGRLLVLMSAARDGGLSSLLSAWGIRPLAAQPVVGAKTLSGTDVVVSGFADHAISAALKGSRIVLERPVSFAPSAAAAVGAEGADRIEFSPVARVGMTAFAAAVERGAGAGADLAIRPTRIVAVGDAGFVLNGQLETRANANRDFFLNCVAYLAGADAPGSGGAEAGVLRAGMDRAARIRHTLVSSVAVPGAVFLLMVAATVRRRRRA